MIEVIYPQLWVQVKGTVHGAYVSSYLLQMSPFRRMQMYA